MPQPEHAHDPLIDRDRLMTELDMFDEASVASVCGWSVKTIKNKPRSELPPFVKVGRKRLFPGGGLREWLSSKTVTDTTILRRSPAKSGKTKGKGKPKAQRIGKRGKAELRAVP